MGRCIPYQIDLFTENQRLGGSREQLSRYWDFTQRSVSQCKGLEPNEESPHWKPRYWRRYGHIRKKQGSIQRRIHEALEF